MVRLEIVNESTFCKVVDMKLGEEQNRYVAPNVVSLAQAWLYYSEARPYAVLDGDKVVGFMMLDWDEGERTVLELCYRAFGDDSRYRICCIRHAPHISKTYALIENK